MSARSRVFGVSALVLLLLWLFFTPHLAVRGMRAAAEARDAAALADYVNFPALKESLKGGLTAKLASFASKDLTGNPFAAFGAALATAMMGPMIDALVTPEALAMMLKGEKPKPTGPAKKPTPNDDDVEVDVSMSYETLNRFVVAARRKGSSEAPMSLVFTRDGLFSWKLSAIRLPD